MSLCSVCMRVLARPIGRCEKELPSSSVREDGETRGDCAQTGAAKSRVVEASREKRCCIVGMRVARPIRSSPQMQWHLDGDFWQIAAICCRGLSAAAILFAPRLRRIWRRGEEPSGKTIQRQFARSWRGADAGGLVALFAAGGQWLDARFDTKPWLLLVLWLRHRRWHPAPDSRVGSRDVALREAAEKQTATSC